jgi:hypothetical protein
MIMSTNWIDPNAIVGSGAVATGSNFYLRNDIVEDILDKIKKGNSVLLAAPRRVGKTSIMQYMEQYPVENHKLIFQNIEGITSANEFFERIYTMLFNCLNKTGKAKEKGGDLINFLKSITKIGPGGIERKPKSIDYLKATNTLLTEINKIKDLENIILLLDELPIMLYNINKKNNKEAICVLENMRYWRQQPEMNKKIKFVLAGSVGIHYVVDIIDNRNAEINDLAVIDFKPLSEKEACKYIDWATNGASVAYTANLKQYLLNKINYYVPFFINLLLDEINKQAKKTYNPTITNKCIDIAFDIVIERSDYFDDWKNRLQKFMPQKDFNFVNEILIHAAHKGSISLQQIYDKAIKHEKTVDYIKFIKDLKKDGYIIEFEKDNYRFISPFLSAFWKKNNPIYNF